MNFTNTKEICYTNGYLNALSDMSGRNYQFFSQVFLSKKNNTDSILKMLSVHMNDNINIIKKKNLENYSLPNILNKLIILKPYSELYGALENNIIPNNIENKYKKYITDRLSDSIDDIYNELEDCNDLHETSNLTVILAKNTYEDYRLILIETRNGYNLIFYFYYPLTTTEKCLSLYSMIQEHQIDTSNIKITTVSELPDATALKLARVLDKIQSQGFMDDKLKNILLKYYSEEKINSLKEIYKV